MKVINKIPFLVIIISFLITFTVGFNGIREKYSFIEETKKELLTIWHVDTFEGGTGSRRKFLLDVATEFEKKHNVIIAVNSYSVLEIEEKLEKNTYPDIISFSNGINVSNLKELKTDYNAYGAKIGKNSYAVPWCRGGYVLISKGNVDFNNKEIDNLIVSSSEYNLPVLALLEEGYTIKKMQNYNPKTAYQKFLALKDGVMIGTQRDVVRLSYTNNEFNIIPLTTFNDMFQYIGITTCEESKIKVANEYVDYLLSEKVQQKLVNLKLFSDVIDLNYENNELNVMQKATDFATISVFIDKNKIREIKNLFILNTPLSEEEYLKIKKLYVKP